MIYDAGQWGLIQPQMDAAGTHLLNINDAQQAGTAVVLKRWAMAVETAVYLPKTQNMR